MAYTSLLGLLLPATGSLTGTWGDAVNNQITQLIEDSVAGTASASIAGGDWTLTDVDGATDTARNAILIATGTVTPAGTTRYINAPQQSKAYVVINQSDTLLYVRGGTTPTTGTPIRAGSSAVVAWNGSDFITIAGGGGGATGGGLDQVFYNNGQTVTTSYSIPSSQNAGTFGPVTINSGVTVTVPTGSVWTVV
jgi:hypothetical protein